MDYIKYCKHGQEVVIAAEELLQDSRFSWRERKEKTMKLYELYEKAGYPEYAARTRDCATFLQFGEYANGERRLQAANFCKLRLCPMCISRRAKRSAWLLSQILDQVEQEHQAKFIFLTLTMRNVEGHELGAAISDLTAAWARFSDQRQIERSFPGWFRAIEITSSYTRSGMMYHPHIHAICAVDADYFSRESRRSGKYLNQSELIERWQKALRVDYRPSVRIQTTRAKAGEGQVLAAGGGKAAAEAGKYAVKDDEYINPDIPEKRAVAVLRDYTQALYKRRMTGLGGWLKEAARRLDAENLEDGDLVRVDEDSIRTDLAEMAVTFHWRFGAGDYVLAGRDVNPLRDAPRGRVKQEAPVPVVPVEEPSFTELDEMTDRYALEQETPWEKD